MDLKPNSQTPLSAVLAGKGRGTSTLSVAPDITVAAAAAVLIQNQAGSVLVMDGGRLVGIFTERDILAIRRPPAWPT
jgi:CBS domain-containing protein